MAATLSLGAFYRSASSQAHSLQPEQSLRISTLRQPQSPSSPRRRWGWGVSGSAIGKVEERRVDVVPSYVGAFAKFLA